jgi:hypothetical protein
VGLVLQKYIYTGLWFFALPLEVVKNRDLVYERRPVVLNDIAKEVIRKQMGDGEFESRKTSIAEKEAIIVQRFEIVGGARFLQKSHCGRNLVLSTEHCEAYMQEKNGKVIPFSGDASGHLGFGIAVYSLLTSALSQSQLSPISTSS